MKKKNLVLTVLAALLVLGGVFGGVAQATNVSRGFAIGANFRAVISVTCNATHGVNGLGVQIENLQSGARTAIQSRSISDNIACGHANGIQSDTVSMNVGNTARGHFRYRRQGATTWRAWTTLDQRRNA